VKAGCVNRDPTVGCVKERAPLTRAAVGLPTRQIFRSNWCLNIIQNFTQMVESVRRNDIYMVQSRRKKVGSLPLIFSRDPEIAEKE